MKNENSKTVETDINKKAGENRQEKGKPLKLRDIISDLNRAFVENSSKISTPLGRV